MSLLKGQISVILKQPTCERILEWGSDFRSLRVVSLNGQKSAKTNIRCRRLFGVHYRFQF